MRARSYLKTWGQKKQGCFAFLKVHATLLASAAKTRAGKGYLLAWR
jgi:hypothetical protein